MNQENKFGEYWKKILQYWAVFTAACGRFWEKVKVHTKAAWAWLSRNGKLLLQKLAAWLLIARDWIVKNTKALGRNSKVLLQKFAAWLLKVRQKVKPALDAAWEKVGIWFRQAKTWCAAMIAKLPRRKTAGALPAADPVKAVEAAPQTQALPAAKEVPAVAPQAEVGEEAGEESPEEEAPAGRRWLPQVQNPYLKKALAILAAIGSGIKFIIKWIWKLRSVFMAIPVVWAAVKLAMLNMERLPEMVGLDIQSTGEFARMITREDAVYWPLGLTVFCLVLMLFSKKPLLPWVISIFTLVLPWLIWILNYYA